MCRKLGSYLQQFRNGNVRIWQCLPCSSWMKPRISLTGNVNNQNILASRFQQPPQPIDPPAIKTSRWVLGSSLPRISRHPWEPPRRHHFNALGSTKILLRYPDFMRFCLGVLFSVLGLQMSLIFGFKFWIKTLFLTPVNVMR